MPISSSRGEYKEYMIYKGYIGEYLEYKGTPLVVGIKESPLFSIRTYIAIYKL